jgi:hypothetical protein
MRKYRVAVAAATAAVVVLVAAFAGLSHAQDAVKAPAKPAEKQAAFVSNKTCKMCHSGAAKGEIYEKWVASSHSKAFTVLPAEAKKNPKCFACHTTGAGKTGGYDPAAKNAVDLEGVGCESCHGAAGDYKLIHNKDKAKALTLGLVMPTEATCKSCHAGVVPEGHKALPKFDFAVSKTKVEHKLPPKK